VNERVIAYIDGFNLYFGIRTKGWRSYYWLNVQALCEKFLLQRQQLVLTKYFTSRIRGNQSKCARQGAFLDALGTIPDLMVFRGKYGMKTYQCRSCNYIGQIPSEKITDVRIASEMVTDAHKDKFDTAFLISGDKDLKPAVEAVKSQFPDKHVVVIFPPARHCDDLRKVADVVLHVWEGHLKKSLLPQIVTRSNGSCLTRPLSWP